MSNAMSKAEANALSVIYEVAGSQVALDLPFVKKYLVRGRADLVSDQEIVLFMNTCKNQGMNPLVNGEVYLIKYSKDDPAQIVVGKGTYLRRAVENPGFQHKEDGILVLRGDEIVKKEGCCPYPGEKLLGGWCRITYVRNGKEFTAYKEVALSEYDKNMANWKSKPATMINKVAVSQCCREAFPRDFQGTYSEDEMVAAGAIPAEYTVVDDSGSEPEPEDPPISQEQRQALFKMAHDHLGKDEGNKVILTLIQNHGLNSTTGMKVSTYNKIVDELVSTIQSLAADPTPAEEPDQAGEPEDQ